MTLEQKARLKAVIIKGLLSSSILVAIIWSYGYMTGNRLGLPLLPIVAIIFGILSGAQAYAVQPEKKDDAPEEMLAAFQAKAEERSRKR